LLCRRLVYLLYSSTMLVEPISAKNHILDCGERLIANKGFVGVGLAEILVGLDRIPSAQKEIDALLRVDPKHIEARLLRANLLGAENQEKAAERVLRDILATDPACAKAGTALSDLLTDFGDEALSDQRLPQAHKHLAEAHRLDPENLDALAYLAATEKLMGDPFAYQAHLEKLLARGTDLAYAKAFEIHTRSLDKEGARRIITRVEREGKASSTFWFLAATIVVANLFIVAMPKGREAYT